MTLITIVLNSVWLIKLCGSPVYIFLSCALFKNLQSHSYVIALIVAFIGAFDPSLNGSSQIQCYQCYDMNGIHNRIIITGVLYSRQLHSYIFGYITLFSKECYTVVDIYRNVIFKHQFVVIARDLINQYTRTVSNGHKRIMHEPKTSALSGRDCYFIVRAH